MRNVKKIFVVMLIIILALGIFVLVKRGFNYGIEYKEVTELKFMLGQVLDMNEVESIVNKAFNNKEVKVQKIDYFNDSINISVVGASDDEIQTLIDKFNERYAQNNTMDTVSIVKTGNISFMEIVEPYIFPTLLVIVLIAVYMGVRFKQQGVLNVVLRPLVTLIVAEVLFFIAYSVAQIPITIWTLPIAMGIVLITLTLYTYKYEKNM